MDLLEILQGYYTLRKLKKEGYVEDDKLSLGGFVKLVLEANRSIYNRKDVDGDEN